jgi:hypothetical protein
MLEKQYTIQDVVDKLNQSVLVDVVKHPSNLQDKLKEIDEAHNVSSLTALKDDLIKLGISVPGYTGEIIVSTATIDPSQENILSVFNALYSIERKLINAKKNDSFIEALEKECFEPLETLKRQQLQRRDRCNFGGRTYHLTLAKIAAIDRILFGMNQPVEIYQTKWILPTDAVIRGDCRREVAQSIQHSLKTNSGADTADYQALKECVNRIAAYLTRFITCFTGAILIVGFFSSFKKGGFRTESHATAHQVLKNIQKLSI